MKIKLFKYIFLNFLILAIYGITTAFASCGSEINWGYKYVKNNFDDTRYASEARYVKYSFESYSTKEIRIEPLMFTGDGNIVAKGKPLYLGPYKKETVFIDVKDTNMNAVSIIDFSCKYKNEPVSKKYDPLKVKEKYDSRNDFKNYWWVLILLVLGAFFLYTTTVKKPLRKFNKKKIPKKTESRIARYWAGHDSLAFSFWGVCTLLLGVASIPLFLIDNSTDTMSGLLVIVSLIYSILFLVGAVIAYVGCWRSAGFYIKSKQKKKDSAFWGYTTYVVLTLSVLRDIIRMTEGL